MIREFDPRAEAEEAVRRAFAAIDTLDRAKWLRIAVAWQDLSRADDAALQPVYRPVAGRHAVNLSLTV